MSFIYPRRQLGPDAIKYLQNTSKQLTGDKATFFAGRLQRSSNGHPNKGIHVDTLELIGPGHPDSYGHFVTRKVVRIAERFEKLLANAPADQVWSVLSRLLRQAKEGETTAWWVLSTNAMRRHLFPDAYDPDTGYRTDRVKYRHYANDRAHVGRVAELQSLSPSNVRRFKSFASKVTNGQIDPQHITPITKGDA